MFLLRGVLYMATLDKETKKSVCESLGLSIATEDDKVISTYIEEMDDNGFLNKPEGPCDDTNCINKQIDFAIKHHKSRKAKGLTL